MSDVTRYNATRDTIPIGEFVLFSDYDRDTQALQRQVQTLQLKIRNMESDCDEHMQDRTQTQLQNNTPSTDIAAAWEVVEKLKRGECTNGMACAIHLYVTNVPGVTGDYLVIVMSPAFATVKTRADTAPLAICLAALKAVGYTNG